MKRAEKNQVRQQVRRYVLQHQEFTMNQLAEATGANRESLRTEVARLIKEGKIESTRDTRVASADAGDVKASVGRPPRLYQVVKDPETIEALRQSILRFHDSEDHSPPNRPTGSVFRHLRATLNRAMGCDAREREELLTKAERDLEFLHAMFEESETTETFRAYLKMEELRIGYLRRQYGNVVAKFDQLADLFNRVGDLDSAEHAENFALACRSVDKWEAPLDGVKIERAATVYESITAGACDPLVIIARQFVRQVFDRYEQIQHDHRILRQENLKLRDLLRQVNLMFQDRLAQLKKTFANVLQNLLLRAAPKSGRRAVRVGHNPRHALNASRFQRPTHRSFSIEQAFFETGHGESYSKAFDSSLIIGDSLLSKYADAGTIKYLTERDSFVEVLDDFITSTEESRSNQPGDALMGGPPDRAEFQFRAEQLPARLRSPFPEENEKVWPSKFTQLAFEAAK